MVNDFPEIEDSISSYIFNKDFLKLQLSQCYPISKIFTFFYLQVFISLTLSIFPFLVSNKNNQDKSFLYYIPAYCIVCIFLEITFIVFLKRKVKIKLIEKDLKIEKISLDLTKFIIFETFCIIKIFTDFLSIIKLKNYNELNSIKNSKIYEIQLYLNGNTCIVFVFLIMLNIQYFNNSKNCFKVLISTKVYYLLLLSIFFGISIIFLIMYFLQNNYINKNKLE